MKTFSIENNAFDRADSVIEKADKFYDKELSKSIGEIDSSYNSKNPALEYNYIKEKNIRNDLKFIRETIEDGGAIDGAKDIIPMSKKTAKSIIGDILEIKGGPATKVIEKIGISKIKEMKDYDKIKEDYNLKVKDKNEYFDIAIEKFNKILELYDSDKIGSAKDDFYNIENNAMISALSKIIKGEGIKNDNIDFFSENFEMYLNKLSNETKESIETPTSIIDSAKIEKKIEEPKKIPLIEPFKTVDENKKPASTISASENKASAAPLEKAVVKSKKDDTKPISNDFRVSFLKDVFNIDLDKDDKSENSIVDKLGLSNSYELNKDKEISYESILEGNSNSLSKEKQEVKNKVDNIPINDISKQKLIKTVSTTETNKKVEETKNIGENEKDTTRDKESNTSSAVTNTGSMEKESNKTTNESGKDSPKTDEILGKKLDLVTSLLMQLNETMQGPLLVANISKKIE